MIPQDREVQEMLYDKYWVEKKSLTELSKELNIPYKTLQLMFVKLGVARRTHSQSTKLWWKKRRHKRF